MAYCGRATVLIVWKCVVHFTDYLNFMFAFLCCSMSTLAPSHCIFHAAHDCIPTSCMWCLSMTVSSSHVTSPHHSWRGKWYIAMLLAAVQGMAGVSTGYARLPQQPVFYLVANGVLWPWRRTYFMKLCFTVCRLSQLVVMSILSKCCMKDYLLAFVAFSKTGLLCHKMPNFSVFCLLIWIFILLHAFCCCDSV